ncbi:MAG: hypothetical protein WAL20_08415, partial [Rhodomicrobium sp.]
PTSAAPTAAACKSIAAAKASTIANRPTAEATATKTAATEAASPESAATETTTPEAATTEDQGEGAFAVASDLIMTRARGSGRRGIR